jgi:hypothetical protein
MNTTSADREYRIGLTLWMCAYVAMLTVSIYVIQKHSPQGLLLYAFAASPSVPIGGTLWQMLRYLERADEYVRAVMTRRFVLATGATLFICTFWGFLESNAGVPRVDLYLVYPLFWGCFGLVSGFVRQAS